MRLARRDRLGELLSAYDDRSFTYPEVGATASQPPPGYRHLRREATFGRGEEAFERAARALLTWTIYEGAGLAVAADGTAAPGRTVLLGLGRPLSLVIPCRVAYVVGERRRRVLATGTLAGHPLSGEEAFTVTMDDNGVVTGQIVSFSRPASVALSALGPLAPLMQSGAASRYLGALRSAASS